MRRSLLSLLLLASLAAAQGVDEWIEQILDPRTAPEQRVDALKRVGQSKEGLDKLAEKGLDGRRDTEVVHAVVDTLLKAADYRPYIDRVCRLLLVEKHRDKVLRRLQVVGEHPERGQPLLDGLGAIAREATDPAMREAAILALGKIPRRRGAEIIVEVGLGATDERVRSAAEAYVRRLFPVESIKEAKDYLDSRRLDSFWDLVQGRIDQLLAVQKEQQERVRDYLRKATAADALEVFGEGGSNRIFAAERLRELAEQNAVPEAAGFARALVDRALARELERDPPDARVLAELIGALYPYAREAAGPLWQVKEPKEVRELIQGLADLPGNGPDHEKFGREAVRLLTAIDDEGLAINAFAENFSSVDVRKEALQQLGALADRLRPRQNYVGIKLAGLLSRNKGEPVLRAQILSLLTQNHVPVAREPDVVGVLRGFLDKGATPELSDAELRDCTIVLGKSRTPEAKEALLKAAAGHRDLKVRRFAVEEALLPWARVDPEIHEAFKALALAADQPLEARRAVIEALGRRGGSRSAETLAQIEASPDLPPDLLPIVREAKLQLARRLASGEASDAPEQRRPDLDAAWRLLEQGLSGDPERLEKVAEAIVRAADAAKLPAGSARYRMAWLYVRRPAEKQDESALLGLYQQAVDKAVGDELPADLREAMLREYKGALLLKPDNDRLARAAACSEQLGELALERKDKLAAASHFFDGADCAIKRKDRGLADRLLNRAKESGGIGGELVAREKELRVAVDNLPKG